MSYIPSVNIESNIGDDFQYIVTPNSKSVLGNIVSSYQSGIHSFTIIGTYGTGKSSFIMALERDLINNTSTLVQNNKVFGESKDFEFLNVVGDYLPLSKLLGEKLEISGYDNSTNLFSTLDSYYLKLKEEGKFLFIIIDEFGKILEHAANNNPEKELYFLQRLAEFVNVPTRNIILLTTLHQNFGAYAYKLSESQRNEWIKVKGRFKEIVFAEPVEQLLFLASEQLHAKGSQLSDNGKESFIEVFSIAKTSKAVSDSLTLATAKKLYPLDPISATCLTLAIQRYGQNERTLFSFLSACDDNAINKFVATPTQTYNLAKVYDYISYNFYTYLSEANADSMNWRAMRVALSRVESGIIVSHLVDDCSKIIKTIGLLNLFCGNIKLNEFFLTKYALNALGIKTPKTCIDKLATAKIIRYATYKSQYILFEGTDIDIEDELYKAASIVPVPVLSIDEIAPYILQNVSFASAFYYRTGTPRYFEYTASNEPKNIEPTSDIDGYINMIFPLSDIKETVIESSITNENAIIYVYFDNTDDIVLHLYEIKKLQYLLDKIVLEDHVAQTEIENQLRYETQLLNDTINNRIVSGTNYASWIYKGSEIDIRGQRDLNKLLSNVCNDIYNSTPIIKNELFNKQKLSSAISLARVNLLNAMIANSDQPDFNIENFPPEKTIYYTLLKNTGIHRQDEDGTYFLGEPTNNDVKSLWNVCDDFIKGCADKPRKLSELSKILQTRPYKLKQGVIDFWIPIFLYVKQQDLALYHDKIFIMNITKEVLELLQKHLNGFSIKSFNITGVKLEFFNKYRQFLQKNEQNNITSKSFVETIRPFFKFYRGLNEYAKSTKKFDSPTTAEFRDVLSEAQDPSKTFFEDLPAALGYKHLDNDEFVQQYLDLIRSSVRELNICYDRFIDRIEDSVLKHLGLLGEFNEYKTIIEERYKSVNSNLLTKKAKSFLDRVIAPSTTRREFYEKIGLIIFDKRIESIKDNEEDLFIKNLLYLFSELERYTSISIVSELTDEESFSFELASSKGKFTPSQTFRLPKAKMEKANDIEEHITNLLSDDKELDICILLKMLNERI
jgi:hypothetical protein